MRELEIQRRDRLIGVFLIVLGVLLYLGLLSTNYDLNGITEARAIEQGGHVLFSPNHILYRPVVWCIYRLLQNLGYTSVSLLPAQITTALCGAFGLGLFYWWLRRLAIGEITAVVFSLGLGTSWAYWVFSTDVFYIIPAAMAVTGALILLATIIDQPDSRLQTPYLVGLGICVALAVLLWQANVVFVPIALIGLFAAYRVDARKFLSAATVFLSVASVLIACVYLGAGTIVMGYDTVQGFLEWLLRYEARLPVWGIWEIDRLPAALKSSVSSLVPIWEGLGLRALLRGEFRLDKLVSQMSLVALVLLTLLPLLRQLGKRTLSRQRIQLIGGLLLMYAVYTPFIVWWDPFEPKWFVIPNIALWTVLAVLWTSSAALPHHLSVLCGLILTISVANFSATIWPRHVDPNRLLQRAECVARHMGEKDLFATTEWNWSGYVDYFCQRQVFSLIDASARYRGKENALDLLRRTARDVQRSGGQVYMVDVSTYSVEHADWLASQTGLVPVDLLRFKMVPAFVCDEIRFQQLESIDESLVTQ